MLHNHSNATNGCIPDTPHTIVERDLTNKQYTSKVTTNTEPNINTLFVEKRLALTRLKGARTPTP